MDSHKAYFRYAMLFLYQKGFNPHKAREELLPVFGEDTLNYDQIRIWFNKFNNGDYSIEDEPRSGRPQQLDNNDLIAAVRDNPRSSTHDLGEQLGVHHSTIVHHLANLGFKKKFGRWIPHKLTEDQQEHRVTICASLISRKRTFEWLKDLVTGDEKWVLYSNESRKGQWVLADEEPEPDPKSDLHPRKIMLTVFWDYKGILFFELLPHNITINAEYYCNQLDSLHHSITKNRPEKSYVILLHDNARPHTAVQTIRKITENLGWEILPHPAYSPDISPTDYHLFRHLSNYLHEKNFVSSEHLFSDISSYFNSLPPKFFEEGIRHLPNKWKEVVSNNGTYCK